MNQITFIPVGGLANRMRSIASVITLAQQTQSHVYIKWFQDWALHASFYKLFEPINKSFVTLKDASLFDHLCIDRPRNKNLYIPRLYQSIIFGDAIYERAFYSLIQQNFNFAQWVEKKQHVYMASYSTFIPYPETLIRELFIPIKKIQQDLLRRSLDFQESVIGVHIRRTDNTASIENSPLSLFYKKLDADIDNNPASQIYLATDSEEVKQEMKQRYGKRLISSDRPANRNSLEGIQDGILDMYTLAHTKKIYGSFQSSFSEMAAQIGNIPLEIIQNTV